MNGMLRAEDKKYKSQYVGAEKRDIKRNKATKAQQTHQANGRKKKGRAGTVRTDVYQNRSRIVVAMSPALSWSGLFFSKSVLAT